jgi:hypothetical protein
MAIVHPPGYQDNFRLLRVVVHVAVAALGARPDLIGERRNHLRIQDRRSETAAPKIKLTHYPAQRLRELDRLGNLYTNLVAQHARSLT